MIDYEKELNESQLRAVEYNDGPSLVIAGAGSGKTRVLTYKIARLMDDGYQPWEILALTFTNKAAAEMKERIARRVGDEQARYLWMGTFHSIFAKILRREAEHIGFSSNFTIYDQSDSRSLIGSIVKEMGLDDKVYKTNAVQARISEAKNSLITARMYYNDALMVQEDMRRRQPAIRDIYNHYAVRLAKSDALDFDDLLMATYYLFKNKSDVLQRYRDRFRFVLVDEYQDTNLAQHEIVWQLTAEQRHICVVGDDSQSIYSFRGARIDNILAFQNRYEGSRLFKLEQNYRSTQSIVSAANSLIAHNQNRIPKEVFSQREVGEPVKTFEAASDKEEAAYVVRQIETLSRRHGLDWNDFAILYRTNSQSRLFEEELRRSGIDYRIYGGLSFYQRKEIKDIIAYFRLIVNPNDEEAFKRIVNYPARGIGDGTLQKVIDTATQRDVSLWSVAHDPDDYMLPVSKGIAGRLKAFCQLIEEFSSLAHTADAYETALEIVVRSGIKADIFGDLSDEGRSRQENVQELMDGIQDFVVSAREEDSTAIWLSDFLAGVALLTDQDSSRGVDVPRVTLMTVHSAKGLEFNTVFVVGMEEDLFPSSMAETPAELEEERRLCYVAVTRAEQRCLLTSARTRFRFGQLQFGTPSRFIAELRPAARSSESPSDIPHRTSSSTRCSMPRPSTAERPAHHSWGTANPTHPATSTPITTSQPTPSRPATSATPKRLIALGERGQQPTTTTTYGGAHTVAQLSPGMKIEHERFGNGLVVSVEGTGPDTKATISFEHVGTKTLLLKFARFKVICE